MTHHTTALVPAEAWCYSSPDVALDGSQADVGLFAESLIYYERVLLNFSTERQWAELLEWLLHTRRYEDFLAMLRAGEVVVYDYSFFTAPIETRRGTFELWNVQDPVQQQPGTFLKRVLEKPAVQHALRKRRRHRTLLEALDGRVIEAKAAAFGAAVADAKRDYADPRRNAVVVQAFVDALYRVKNLGRPPQVEAVVTPTGDGTGHHITWNVNFDELRQLAGPRLAFHSGMPLTGGAMSNRHLQAAALEGCDLFLGSPIDRLVGDKLYETARTPGRSAGIIEELKQRVDFPNVRRLVNAGRMDLGHVLELRRKGARFRGWLQSEADRDRDAIVAYHHEVAREAGYTRLGRSVLSLFGVLGGAALGGAIGGAHQGALGGAAGGAAGGALTFGAGLIASLRAGWRPVVFGDWVRDRVDAVERRSDAGAG